ncbi:hypothetical protein KUV41_05790 [Halomonas sp. DP8Y7-1]|nr:hypothetical protein [Halomonas sp. DP8Y7-1]
MLSVTSQPTACPDGASCSASGALATDVASLSGGQAMTGVSFYWSSFTWYWFDTGALVREA